MPHGPARAGQPRAANTWLVEIVALSLFVVVGVFLLARAAVMGIWLIGPDGLPIATDFNAYWSAGYLAAHGDAATVYDWGALQAVLERHYPKSFADSFDFFYPPTYLLTLAPLGFLPYLWAAVVWIGATWLAYLAAIRAILPTRTAILVALGAPGALMAIWVGQNGMLTAALFGGALALFDKRPAIAGVLIGLLTIKPQFGVLIPFLLAATGRWTIFAAAAATAAAIALLAALLFGWGTYPAFFAAFADGGDKLLVEGLLPWFKMQSVYGLARTIGLSGTEAWVAHGLVAATAAIATLGLWRSDASFDLKAAALPVAALAITPHVCIYDLPVAIVAIVFLLRDGIGRAPRLGDQAALALALLLPAAFPVLRIPVGPFLFFLLAVLIGWRWRQAAPRPLGSAAAGA